jgi:hypothetical protein
MLNAQAACPCFMAMLHVYAAMSLLHISEMETKEVKLEKKHWKQYKAKRKIENEIKENFGLFTDHVWLPSEN